MSTKVLLIRHGETEWNKSGRFQGCTDIPLTDEGRYQAEKLAKRLDGNYDIIYSSPLSRALETARIINRDYDQKIVMEDNIREVNFGQWEGLTKKQIEENFKSMFDSWINDKKRGNIIGGDKSILSASLRARDCILKIVQDNRDKTIIIVAHGGIIKAGLIGIFGWDMTMYHKIALGNTCINKIVFKDDMTPILCSLNDNCHLEI